MNQTKMRIDNTKQVALHSAKLSYRFVMIFHNGMPKWGSMKSMQS